MDVSSLQEMIVGAAATGLGVVLLKWPHTLPRRPLARRTEILLGGAMILLGLVKLFQLMPDPQ